LLNLRDKLAAYLFDCAVVTFGTIVENASQELEKRGPEDKPRWENKYTMKQLLDPAFRLPLGDDDEQGFDGGESVEGMIFDEVS
jgi:hypothetical protein